MTSQQIGEESELEVDLRSVDPIRRDPEPDSPLGSTRWSTRLIEEHLPLVGHVVFQVAAHFPRHVDRDELARAGALGLVEAAQRFDPRRGVPFNRFAAQRIRGAILDAVRSADWAPRSVRTLARQLDQTEQRLATELGRIPSLHETADALSMSVDELERLRSKIFRSVVLVFEQLVGDASDDDLALVDVLADPRSSSRRSNSRTGSCAPTSATRSRCCRNATASSSPGTSSMSRRRRTSPGSWA